MNAPLYTADILRLASSLGEQVPLDRIDGSGDERAPTCGSRVRTEVQLADDGSVAAIAQDVHACAFGQASAALLARHAPGRTGTEIDQALADLTGWLAGDRDDPGPWPGLDALAPARSRRARHPAILLPFRALLAAIRSAR
ncbi:MAG TPA: iron-sulfur cluster assembly scaffold protein [Sphingomicrobium sp.]|nr:iron-sulfur cluster assembly scaffold protein [Sphingomicrobium sp.]